MIKNMEVNDIMQCMKSRAWTYLQRWLNSVTLVALPRAARETNDSVSRDKHREWATHTYEEGKTEAKQQMQSVRKQVWLHNETIKVEQDSQVKSDRVAVSLLPWDLIGWRCQLLEAWWKIPSEEVETFN